MHGWGSMAGEVLVYEKKHGNNLKPMYNSCVIRYKSICQLANAGDYRKKEVKT